MGPHVVTSVKKPIRSSALLRRDDLNLNTRSRHPPSSLHPPLAGLRGPSGTFHPRCQDRDKKHASVENKVTERRRSPPSSPRLRSVYLFLPSHAHLFSPSPSFSSFH